MSLEDFSNTELIEELECRGYRVGCGIADDLHRKNMKSIYWEYQRGNIKEALFLLEREFPELSGLTKCV
jgi:hypothetical protein